MKKIFSFLLTFVVCSAFIFPFSPRAQAQGIPGFSGYPISPPIVCTCSATIWSFFAPLWFTIVPLAGPVVYVPYATIPYPYFTPTMPATSHAGAILYGAGACWMYGGWGCVLIPSWGAMMWVGTGVPGASIK